MHSTTMRSVAWAAFAVVACPGGAAPSAPAPAPTGTVQELMTKDLVGAPGKELRMLTVEYPPGGASPPHRHDAQVFVYVLAGALRMQVAGAPAVTLAAGQTFYEGRDDVHTLSANASRTEPAKFLVLMVKDKGAPVSGAVSKEGK